MGGGNSFGQEFRVTTFGESHGAALGVIIDGVPPNVALTAADIQAELDRRRPGQSKVATPRNESDQVEILSGVFENRTTGTSLALLIRNNNQQSKDYHNIAEIFRPGHADWGFFAKYGIRDYRGGGRSSGRETAGRVAAGAVAKKILLEQYNINTVAYVTQVGGIQAETCDLSAIEQNIVRCADPHAAEKMVAEIIRVTQDHNSIGGCVECRIQNVPAGIGEPVFDKLDALLAQAALSIGGVKGVEFGDGFAVCGKLGSENNDQRTAEGFLSNHAGGIAGGLSTGQEIVFRVAVKPTPSIARKQQTVNTNGQSVECEVIGRHDPCLCPRLAVVLENMAAIVILDLILRNKCLK